MSKTSFENKCGILSEIWMKYRDDEEFGDFVEYNDIGLPLAHFVHTNLVTTKPEAERFINETFDLFVEGLELKDTGFDSLDDLLQQK